jgi:hypothetical protein
MTKEMLVLAAGAAVVIACTNPPKAPVQGVTTTSAGVVSNADSVQRLAQARCNHAKSCGQFGVGKDYADEAGCMSQISHELEGDYQPSNCPHGVREERLSSCVNAWNNQNCGNVAHSISRSETCRRGNLCIK